ncbi:hypothetical protein [Subtercola frigoramans]
MDVEELVQDTFFTVWLKSSTIILPNTSLLPWLLVTCRNHGLNLRRRHDKHRTDELPPRPRNRPRRERRSPRRTPLRSRRNRTTRPHRQTHLRTVPHRRPTIRCEKTSLPRPRTIPEGGDRQ